MRVIMNCAEMYNMSYECPISRSRAPCPPNFWDTLPTTIYGWHTATKLWYGLRTTCAPNIADRNFATFKLCGKFVWSVLLNVLCPRVVHICSSTAIVNRLRFHSCGSVVSTSVAQLTKMCRPVGCRPVGLSSTRLSPRNGDQSLHDDQTRWEGIFTRSIMSVAVAKIFYDTNNNDNRSFGIMVSPRPRLNH